jgi:hypothetical protein
MRKIVLLLGPAVASLALFACEDSGSGSPGIFTTDSAPFETSPPGEGGLPDVAVDAPAVPGSVTVNVVRGAGPAAGVIVVFHGATGAVLETKTTGADGKATSSAGTTPSQATALLGGEGTRRIVTWTVVQPGDELLVRDFGVSGSASYDITTQGIFAGATSMNASIGSCMGSGITSPISMYLTSDCVRPTTAILARAFGPTAPEPVAYAFAKGKPAPSDAGAGSATVGAWLTPTSTMVTPKNLPAEARASSALFEIADNLGIENTTGVINRLTGATTFSIAPGFADAHQAAVRVEPDQVPGAQLTIAKRGAPAANTDIDFAAPLPTINGATLVAANLAQPQVDWTTLGGTPLSATDGGSVFLIWYDRNETYGTWTLIVPPNATTAKAPALPAAAAAWAPHGANDAGDDAVLFDVPTVVFAEADALPDAAAYRRQIGLVLPPRGYSPDSRAILPAAGTIKLTSFTEPRVR